VISPCAEHITVFCSKVTSLLRIITTSVKIEALNS
jgi:hypothetical protein